MPAVRETVATVKTLDVDQYKYGFETVIKSVLESLRLYLPVYTLQSVMDEVMRWTKTGRSCFEELLEGLGLKKPTESVLEKIIPEPSG